MKNKRTRQVRFDFKMVGYTAIIDTKLISPLKHVWLDDLCLAYLCVARLFPNENSQHLST